MSKTFVYDRFDIDTSGTGEIWAAHDGDWVKAEDAINREAVLQAEIRTLQVQLKEAKAPQWINLKERLPDASGCYLAMMAEENSFGYTSTEPVVVEFDAYTTHPKQFVIDDSWTNGPENANDEITFWTAMPAAPKEPA